MATKIKTLIKNVEVSKHAQKSNKLPGFGLIIHITDRPSPAYVDLAEEFDSVTKAAIIRHDLLGDDHELDDLINHIKTNPGCFVSVDLSSKLWMPDTIASSYGFFNEDRQQGGRSTVDTSELGASRRKDLRLLKRALCVCAECLRGGGHIAFAMPSSSSTWLREEVQLFIIQHQLMGHSINTD